MIDVRTETAEMLKNDDAVANIAGEAIYLINSPNPDEFPRIVIRETANVPAPRYDGRNCEGVVDFRVWLWTKTYSDFFALEQAIDAAMTDAKWSRVSVTEDNFVDGSAVFEKSIVYRKKYFQPS